MHGAVVTFNEEDSMNGARLRTCLLGFALGLLTFGCSQDATNSTAPVVDKTPGPAALYTAVGPEAVPGSYIVVFKTSVSDVDRQVDDISLAQGISAQYRYQHALKGFSATLSPAAVTALRNDPRVDYIEQNQVAHAVGSQTGATWGIDRIDQRALPLNTTYNYNQTGTGIDAYIIDTGIRFTHNEFGGRAVTGVDEITPGGTAADGNGHGTHVAGTVGGATYGVAKAVHLIAVRVLDNSGSGTYAQVIAGVDWVTSNHTTNPAVANMSLGGPVSSALDTAVRNSIADGVVYCIAAGNSAVNVSTTSPADVAEAVTVAASGSNDAWAYFSNYGSGVDIIGPGVNITSSWYTSNTATNTISGTSMATPHVAGAAALYLEAHPGSTPAQVQAGLITASTPSVVTGVPSGTANRLLYSLDGVAPPPPPAPPAAPTLVSPTNGASSVSRTPTLVWNASTDATTYQVQVSTSSSFSSTVYNQSGLAATSVTLPQLGSRVRYYWHVRATNANGTSAWSSTWNFRTVR
jgi:subtilisin family serine protease